MKLIPFDRVCIVDKKYCIFCNTTLKIEVEKGKILFQNIEFIDIFENFYS